MTAPERDVYVMVGDGSYLMMNSETVTSIQENYRLIIVLFDNHGYKSTGSLSRSPGQDGFGTRYAYPRNGILPGDEVGRTCKFCPLTWQRRSRVLYLPMSDNKLIDKGTRCSGKGGSQRKTWGAAKVAMEDYTAIRVSHKTLESF